MLVYFAWLTKGPGGNQVSWPCSSHYACSAVTAVTRKTQVGKITNGEGEKYW